MKGREYVLYTLSTEYNTLYNTAEKPVKSAILKGQTLVNLSPFKSLKDVTPSVLSENGVIWYGGIIKDYFNPSIFKPNTKYIVKFGMGTPSRFKGMYISGLNMPNKNGYYSEHNDVFTTPETTPTEGANVYFKGIDGNVVTKEEYSKIEPMIIEYQEGMENWDIPYFEGMQSVKNPIVTTIGKNLFNLGNINENEAVTKTPTGLILKQYSCTITVNIPSTFPDLKVGNTYTFSFKTSADDTELTGAMGSFGFFNVSTSALNFYKSNQSFVLTEEMYYDRMIIAYGLSSGTLELSNIQLEEGSVATEYESFKSNILTVNEEVELRGIGDVKDELNLLTGELTQRIGEAVYTEKESWYQYLGNEFDDSSLFSCTSLKIGDTSDSSMKTNFISDRFTPSISIYVNNIIGSYIQNGSLFIRVKKEWLTTPDVYGLQRYLQQNPITVQYQLATDSVKTVDLSVVDQDGNNTKLKTFDDITHVILSSEGLIPEAELEVAEKVPEVATSMLTISREQETIDTTANEQSENVDATMIATTEIYEQLL